MKPNLPTIVDKSFCVNSDLVDQISIVLGYIDYVVSLEHAEPELLVITFFCMTNAIPLQMPTCFDTHTHDQIGYVVYGSLEGGTPNHPKVDHLSIETLRLLGIPC